MKFWKEIDFDGNMKEIKAVISDNILNYDSVCVYEHPGDLNKFILPSNGICFVDENGKKKPFYVSVDGTFIRQEVDNIYLTSNDQIEDIYVTTVICGDLTDKDCEDCSTIVFEKGLDDPVFIDIEDNDDHIIIHINTYTPEDSIADNVLESLVSSNK